MCNKVLGAKSATMNMAIKQIIASGYVLYWHICIVSIDVFIKVDALVVNQLQILTPMGLVYMPLI